MADKYNQPGPRCRRCGKYTLVFAIIGQPELMCRICDIPNELSMQYNKQDICDNCGHLYLLHMGNFKNECDACDDPSVPMDKRCPEFKKKEEPKVIKLGYDEKV